MKDSAIVYTVHLKSQIILAQSTIGECQNLHSSIQLQLFWGLSGLTERERHVQGVVPIMFWGMSGALCSDQSQTLKFAMHRIEAVPDVTGYTQKVVSRVRLPSLKIQQRLLLHTNDLSVYVCQNDSWIWIKPHCSNDSDKDNTKRMFSQNIPWYPSCMMDIFLVQGYPSWKMDSFLLQGYHACWIFTMYRGFTHTWWIPIMHRDIPHTCTVVSIIYTVH